jgi:hypothetical protein
MAIIGDLPPWHHPAGGNGAGNGAARKAAAANPTTT